MSHLTMWIKGFLKNASRNSKMYSTIKYFYFYKTSSFFWQLPSTPYTIEFLNFLVNFQIILCSTWCLSIYYHFGVTQLVLENLTLCREKQTCIYSLQINLYEKINIRINKEKNIQNVNTRNLNHNKKSKVNGRK